ncbi:MAG: DUF2788 domain-containing protein [Gammaproteobacteria bacterium]
MTFEQMETIGLYLGIGTLICFMIFIIWDLGKDHNAGRFGTFILFSTLGLGLFGFLVKIFVSELLLV